MYKGKKGLGKHIYMKENTKEVYLNGIYLGK